MTREQFMGRLIELLSDIPEAERNDAILFYESCFEEAGPGEEQNLIAKMGSPEKVAARIKNGLNESNEAYSEYSETGYEDTREPKHTELPEVLNPPKNNSRIILAIIALIFLSPFLKGLFSGAAGVLITILLLPFLAVFALGVAAIGLILGGLASVASGIPLCFASAPVGILTIGVGCILGAGGLASLAALTYIASRWLPRVIAFFTNLFYRIFHRKEANRR